MQICQRCMLDPKKEKSILACHLGAPLEFVFQEQSYSSLHSGWSYAWDHFCGDIADPCGVIADFCGVIADPCGVIVDPCGVVAIGSRAVMQSLGESLNIV